ncbi:transcriptional regulator, Crp/Fnr family [Psychroflexus torquis ATCC 700755]|uniref:Transcriptional regulator, Crp/Fnr family n=1 Tax=Psychroflexus torquis (strain ATCC 700755 / CIP 106069 / ACAM 623) TaxID=313595 RepID=K4IQL3_PSYTT|nr:Crp/Fnr family transcriptional regulator [Psychroflexus torquis]AFU67780.1 transcriptional regulator, Crp/Fnr family [Psychroflexus torquis ATCC 700755]
MYKELEPYIKSHGKIGEKKLQQIIKFFKPIRTTRNERLSNLGQVCKHFYFIRKSFLRSNEINTKGNQVTGCFALENSVMSVNTSFILRKPSRDCLVPLEQSEWLVINHINFCELVNTYPPFANVYHQFLKFVFIHSQMRIYSFLGMEGIDKLKWATEHEPKLLSRISSKAVASYLGMTNSTLSKLREKS